MGWRQLLSIYAEAAADLAAEADQPPTACPNDGEPLSTGPDGRLFCRWDGWREADAPPRGVGG